MVVSTVERSTLFDRVNTGVLALLLSFAALAQGANDLWAATLIWLALLILFLVLIVYYSWRPDSPGVDITLLGPLLALLLIFYLSYHQSVNPGESAFALTDWIFSIVLFAIALNIRWSPSLLKFLSMLLVPLFWIQCGVVIFQQAQTSDLAALAENPGTLVNANFAAAFCTFWFPVLIDHSVREWEKNKTAALYLVSGGIALFVNFLLVESTWGWIGVLFGTSVLLIPRWWKPVLSYRKNLFVSLVCLMVLIIIIVIWKKLTFVYDMPSRNPANRLLWWLSAVHMGTDHPWLGVGLGNYPSAYLAYKVGTGENTLYPHSFPLGLFSESGVLGLGGFLFFLTVWGRQAWSEIKSNREKWPYVTGIFTFLFFSLISLSYELFLNLLTFFFFAAIIVNGERTGQWKPRRSLLLVIVAAGTGLIPFLISPFLASQDVVEGRQKLILQGNADGAAKEFGSAVKLDPQSWEAHQGLSMSLAAQNLGEAIREQRMAIQKNKLNASLHGELGAYLEKEGNFAEALTEYKQAALLHHTSPLYQREVDRLEKRR